MPDEGDNVERAIVDGLVSFLDGSMSDAQPTAMLPGALGRLFERLLANEQGWSRYAWIDDAKPESMTRLDASTVTVTGIATIVEGKTRRPSHSAALSDWICRGPGSKCISIIPGRCQG